MVAILAGAIISVVGGALAIIVGVVGHGLIPRMIERTIVGEVALVNNSVQLDRFRTVPFPLNFSVRFFNISNPDDVLTGGVPSLREIGPYIFKLNIQRDIVNMDDDNIVYRRVEHLEFDTEASYPLTEDDSITVANVAYNTILQTAETMFPNLMPLMGMTLSGVFETLNSPIMTVRVGDLLLDGLNFCQNPNIAAAMVCSRIAAIGENAKNLEVLSNGSIRFSVLQYKQDVPSQEYVVSRGLANVEDLGRISQFNGDSQLYFWSLSQESDNNDDSPGVCNMVNGTDTGIFNPFIDINKPLYGLNSDICRSVELRFDSHTVVAGIPAVKFTVNDWFLDNNEGCFCLNVTRGVNAPNGCLLKGAMELYSCVGAVMVLSYPHFLYADFSYRNGVIGMNPIERDHRIFLELEQNTGTILKGAKRVQFNVFLRPVTGITATRELRTSLIPVFWIEEAMELPEEYRDELSSRLLASLRLIDIFVPTLLAFSIALLAAGFLIIALTKVKKPAPTISTDSSDSSPSKSF